MYICMYVSMSLCVCIDTFIVVVIFCEDRKVNELFTYSINSNDLYTSIQGVSK